MTEELAAEQTGDEGVGYSGRISIFFRSTRDFDPMIVRDGVIDATQIISICDRIIRDAERASIVAMLTRVLTSGETQPDLLVIPRTGFPPNLKK